MNAQILQTSSFDGSTHHAQIQAALPQRTAHRNAYGAANAMRPPREVEYDAFSRVTGMLRQSAVQGLGAPLIRAVEKNSQLWTILAADLAQPGNALPDETRAGLLSLAAFSVRHGRAVLQGRATPDALIAVNMSVMKGLRAEAPE